MQNTSEKQYKSGKGTGRKSGKKFTDTEREDVKAKVAQLDRRGYNQIQISQTLKEVFGISVTNGMIGVYLRQIRETYKKAQVEERDVHVQEKLAQYREVRYEAWLAYERSKLDTKKTVREFEKPLVIVVPMKPTGKQDGSGNKKTGVLGSNVPVDIGTRSNSNGSNTKSLSPSKEPEDALALLRMVVTQEGRLPANDYLRTIMTTLENERELLGIDAPKEITHSGSMQVINWNAVLFQKDTPNADNIGYTHDPVLNRILQVENLPERVEGGDESEPVLTEQEG